MTATGVLFVPNTGNKKLGSLKRKARVSTTYVSIKSSCPSSCPLQKTKECYAMGGQVGMHMVKRVEPDKPKSPLEIAKLEAAELKASFQGRQIPQDGMCGGRDLRLHTAGDCRTNASAKRLAEAASDWRSRDGGSVWTYTHAWRNVHRPSWGGDISVMASVDHTNQGLLAIARGYSPAVYIAEFDSAKAFHADGVKWIPCPAQTNDDVGCADCRLCFDDQALLGRNTGIAFAAHGVKRHSMKKRLSVL